VDTQSALLVVEDDPGIRRALSEGLSDGGYVVVTAASAEEALSRLAVIAVDLALVDLKLPGMSGVDLLRELRQRSPTTVLVVMTANPTVNSAVEALRLEAYDYLLKPFTMDEVVRVVNRGLERRRQRNQRDVLLRQLERSLAGLQALQLFGDADSPSDEALPPPANPALLSCGPVEIDLQSHLARVDGQELDLTPTEFNLLVTLADRAPAVVSSQDLLRQATGYQADPAEARELVKWHIHHLRRKIESDPKKPRYIVNVRGVGYRLTAS
jgi:DNA-binding response OmpR family regulator